jgi:hypothetical protein
MYDDFFFYDLYVSYDDRFPFTLQFTPVLGVICVILIFIVLKEPKRGHAEGGANLRNSSYIEDLKELAKT